MADEYFDLLDSDGNKTGQKKLRTLVHKDGDWHRGIHAWLMNNKGQFLLQKRSASKDSHPGMWTLALAGHVISGDSSPHTLQRELEEELGLKVLDEDIEFLFSAKKYDLEDNGNFINNELDDVYLIRASPNIADIRLQKEEVEKVKFISASDLKKLLTVGDPSFMSDPEEHSMLLEYLIKKGLLPN